MVPPSNATGVLAFEVGYLPCSTPDRLPNETARAHRDRVADFRRPFNNARRIREYFKSIGMDCFEGEMMPRDEAAILIGIKTGSENAGHGANQGHHGLDQGHHGCSAPPETREAGQAALHARNEERSAEAAEKDQTEGQPVYPYLKPNWGCPGCEDFDCVRKINLAWFFDVSNLCILQWIHKHQLHSVTCPMCNEESLEPSAQGDAVGLRCKTRGCRHLSKGGRTGIWSHARIPLVENMLLFYAIIDRKPFTEVHQLFNINKNTWTAYVKTVNMVCGETMERDRRQETRKYSFSQLDETAFGKKKNHVGGDVRKGGVQWALTCVEISDQSPDIGKPIGLDIRFLDQNKRGVEQIQRLADQRLAPGGIMWTDGWRAYLKVAEELGLQHHWVNHKENFRDPDTCVNTNAVEGIHAVLKNESRKQFSRLPRMTADGLPLYLDILCWRVNGRLRAKHLDAKKYAFASFCKCLKLWHSDPVEGYVQRVEVAPILGQVYEGGNDEEDDLGLDLYEPSDFEIY